MNEATVRRLTLKEVVLVLKMYQKVQRYSVVAESFGIEKKDVKKIIEISDKIKKRNVEQKYNRIKRNIKKSDFTKKVSRITHSHLQSIAQDNKFKLLEDCVYETLKRKKEVITMELITTTALDFRNIMNLEDFEVNKRWLNIFKYKYNIQFSNQEHVPPESVDLQEVLEYCKLKHLKKADQLRELKKYRIKKSLPHQSDTKSKSSLSISNYQDVLLALRPLEEYAMLNNNYDAVIFINQLERHLKNVKRKNEKE